MPGRQLAVYSRRALYTEEAIEVGARKGLWLGGSWRYIAGGLAEEAIEVAIEVGAQKGLWLGGSWRYIAGGFAEEAIEKLRPGKVGPWHSKLGPSKCIALERRTLALRFNIHHLRTDLRCKNGRCKG